MALPDFQIGNAFGEAILPNRPKSDEVYAPDSYTGNMASASGGSLFEKSSAKAYNYVRKFGIETLFIVPDPIFSDHTTILRIVHSHLIFMPSFL